MILKLEEQRKSLRRTLSTFRNSRSFAAATRSCSVSMRRLLRSPPQNRGVISMPLSPLLRYSDRARLPRQSGEIGSRQLHHPIGCTRAGVQVSGVYPQSPQAGSLRLIFTLSSNTTACPEEYDALYPKFCFPAMPRRRGNPHWGMGAAGPRARFRRINTSRVFVKKPLHSSGQQRLRVRAQ